MPKHEKIDYVEFPSKNFAVTQNFFSAVFDWSFVHYSEFYMAFENAGIDGGFYKSEQTTRTDTGATLVVFYSDDLEATQRRIVAAGGEVVKETFSFPGGRRFHFCDPNGNEYAVWSDKEARE